MEGDEGASSQALAEAPRFVAQNDGRIGRMPTKGSKIATPQLEHARRRRSRMAHLARPAHHADRRRRDGIPTANPDRPRFQKGDPTRGVDCRAVGQPPQRERR
jgi:hypothetical protein